VFWLAFVIHALDSVFFYFDYSLADYFLIVRRKLFEPNDTKLDLEKTPSSSSVCLLQAEN